jgi:hypothetical protein
VFGLEINVNVKIGIYKTIILPIAMYGCETWSLALREKHTLRVFENRVLWRILRVRDTRTHTHTHRETLRNHLSFWKFNS